MKNIWNDDIDWLINDAPSLLGETGASLRTEPGVTGFVETGPMHDRLIGARWAVRKERRLRAIWQQISNEDRRLLLGHYDHRKRIDEFGSHFGELAGAVLASCRSATKLRSVLVGQDVQRRQRVVRERRKVAKNSLEAVHKEWKLLAQEQAMDQECPKWSGSKAGAD